MIPYLVRVFRSPGRHPVRVRAITAVSQESARALAVKIAEQWQQHKRIARYRVSWSLAEVDRVSGTSRTVAAGQLVSAAERRRSE